MQKRKIVIIGASSLIAEHCARLWVQEEGVELILVGRDKVKIDVVAADLAVRSPKSKIEVIHTHFIDARSISTQVDAIAEKGPIDIILIAHGYLADQMTCQHDLEEAKNALMVNGISPVLFAEAFAKHLQKNGKGILAIIGSVAGDRGRQSNYVYGAAKGLIERYAEGLQHRFAPTEVKVILIKPGPTATPMTSHLNMRLASPEEVGRIIVNGIQKGRPVIYALRRWRLIMLGIRYLPRFVFNKIRF